MHKSQYYVHVYNISSHDQPCIEVVYLEFNTLHSTIIYECNILTAVLAEAYTESPMSIILCIKECTL